MHQVGARKCSDGPLSAMHDRCKTKVSEGGENIHSRYVDAVRRALHDDAMAGQTGAGASLLVIESRGKDMEPNIQRTGHLSARCWLSQCRLHDVSSMVFEDSPADSKRGYPAS